MLYAVLIFIYNIINLNVLENKRKNIAYNLFIKT